MEPFFIPSKIDTIMILRPVSVSRGKSCGMVTYSSSHTGVLCSYLDRWRFGQSVALHYKKKKKEGFHHPNLVAVLEGLTGYWVLSGGLAGPSGADPRNKNAPGGSAEAAVLRTR